MADDTTFRWTEQRREALKLVLQGFTDAVIADKVKCHPNTVYNWRHNPVFLAEMKTRLNEYASRIKLKRVAETGALADVLASKLAQALAAEDVAKVAVFGKEYHAFRMEEREDFGDNVKRVEGRFQIDGKQEINVNHTHTLSFKKYLEDHAELIDVTPIAEGATPQAALTAMAESLMQNSDLLEQINEEDKADSSESG